MKMEKALNWWYKELTEDGRNQFPKPKDNDDISSYHANPAEHITT